MTDVDTDTQASVAGNSVLPGVEIVAAIRRVATVAALALLAYMTFTRGSAGACVGGVGADGGYIDANGDPTDVAPQCISLALEPGPVVIIAVVLTFIVALTLVIRRAQTVPAALRILDRATLVILAIAAVSLVVSLVWFGLLPIRDWSPDGEWGFVFPFPFGSVDLSITPMQASVSG
ncbi:hypothetical protein [Microbacterium schleiferi]|uniref:Cell division protein FtsK n=1 Tax=Microbacterium schleiferi TaxID=69362 RepID=A0ABU7V600_9MICO|nr:hypothetical protein [Micrococcales bacterium]